MKPKVLIDETGFDKSELMKIGKRVLKRRVFEENLSESKKKHKPEKFRTKESENGFCSMIIPDSWNQHAELMKTFGLRNWQHVDCILW